MQWLLLKGWWTKIFDIFFFIPNERSCQIKNILLKAKNFISNGLHGKNYWITQFVNQMKTSIWLTNWVITKFGFLEAVWRPFEIKDFGQLHLLHLARTQLFSLTPFFLSSTASTGKFFELLSSSTSPWLTNWVITKFSFLEAAWRPLKIKFFSLLHLLHLARTQLFS